MKYEETETIELKRSTSELKEGIISIVSILNKHQKGQLYFGIKNDGTVIGQVIGKDTVRDISRAISSHIKPVIFPDIEKIELEGKDCILVEFEGSENLYYAYGKAYMRVGDEDKQMNPNQIERQILKKGEKLFPWDSQPSKTKQDDVDEEQLKDFVKKANKAGRIDFEYLGLKPTLKKLNLLVDDKLSNAAEILFCDRNPLEVQMAIFAGTDKLTFLDINQLKGNLFHVLKESELYLKTHMRWSVKFGKLEREEIPEVPVKALREAIVNSLCHRDYVNPKGNEIAIFKDRIEIYNPGQFPEEFEPEDFIKGEERSILRNPLLASTLFLGKDIEKWGSGLKRINDECEAEGVRVEFKKLKSGFLVVFRRRGELGETGVKVGRKLGENYPRTTVKPPQNHHKTSVKRRYNVGKTSVKIILEIEQNDTITIPALASIIGVTERSIERNIQNLQSLGLLKRVGGKRGGHWEIVEDRMEAADE